MGKIVACSTAGSCGILPAVILTTGHLLNKTDDELIQGLFAASAIGMIIGMNATFSGAEGGCQAECISVFFLNIVVIPPACNYSNAASTSV